MKNNYSNFNYDDISTSYLSDNLENVKQSLNIENYIERSSKEIEFSEEDYLDDAINNATEYLSSNVSPVSEPKAMYLISQPGLNRKSMLDAISNSVDSNTIVVKLDDIKRFHPEYKTLVKKQAYSSQRQLNDFAMDVYKNISEIAIKNKNNIVFDSTFIGTYNVMEMSMKNMKEGNHKVEINALSLNQTISTIGVHFNSEVQNIEQGYQTTPTLDEHNQMYENIPSKIEHAINSGLIDNCKLYGMDIVNTKEVLLNNQLDENFTSEYTNERDKVLTLEEIDKIEKFQKDTENLMVVREASIEDIQEFNNLINETKGTIAYSKVNFLDQEVNLDKKELFDNILNADYAAVTLKQCAGIELDDDFINDILSSEVIPDTNKVIGLTILEVPNAANELQTFKEQTKSKSNQQGLSISKGVKKENDNSKQMKRGFLN